ncbi:formyltransferase family protein [Rufibacter roseus]|uniref:Formyltransferase family protein n=1 Tax=Rufibacter roseus TaxID=1567108 RepID=A0ABW2DL58_9BACT|nr:formyltransferase family protein [Rufibacter roseus]
MKKICIAGKNAIAVECTKHVLKFYHSSELCVLVNETDTGHNTWQPSFKKFALENEIEIFSQEQVYNIKNILLISLEFDKLLPPARFNSKRLFNIHFSLLPKYKGQFTSSWPILNFETETGVTLHEIDKGIDTGAIVDQIRFEIKNDDTAKDLYHNYNTKGIELFISNFERLQNNSYNAVPQSYVGSTFYSISSLDYKNVKINLKQTAFQISAQIRAFCFREYQLPQVLGWYVSKVDIMNTSSEKKAGTLLDESESFLLISTVDYDLKVYKDHYYKFFELCKSGSSKELQGIIQLIPNLEERNQDGCTGLMIAAQNGNLEVVEFLSKYGEDFNALNSLRRAMP